MTRVPLNLVSTRWDHSLDWLTGGSRLALPPVLKPAGVSLFRVLRSPTTTSAQTVSDS